MPDTFIAWHASRTPLLTVEPGLHVGTRRQAEMRGGRLHAIEIAATPSARMRDRSENEWQRDRLEAARRRGRALVVYLNRTEGIPLEEFETAWREVPDIDALSDAAFRQLIPSAEDSWIILDPGIVVGIHPETETRKDKAA